MPRRTVARPVEVGGTGLFSGIAATLRVRPAPPGAGVVFLREDLGGDRPIPARAASHVPAERRTALEHEGHRVDTVEHLLAAVSVVGLDDVVLALDGPEVPILDGSCAPFVALLESAGARLTEGRVERVTVAEALQLTDGASYYRVTPAERLSVEVRLEYAEPVIGVQAAAWAGDRESFDREIAPARTFAFEREVAVLTERGVLRGAAAGSGLLLSSDRVINGTARWADEFARHKAGDLVGDLSLLGARPGLRVEARRPSHRGNIACVRAILAAARIVEE